jgi:MFS family permease
MPQHEHFRDSEIREIYTTHLVNTSPLQGEPAPDDSLMGTLMPRGLRSFPTFWTASVMSYLAYTIMQIALPLFAQQITRSPVLVSGISAVRTFPLLAFSLFAGTLVDDYDRRFLWTLVTLLRLIIVGMAIVAALTGYIPLLVLYGVALVFGLAQTLEELTVAAALPMLVPRGKLEFANSWLVGAQNLIELLATPITGVLVTMGIVLTTGIDGFAVIATLVALLFLQGSFRPPRAVKRHILVNILEGVRFLWKLPVLRTIAIMAAVINACWSGYLAVLVLYAIKPGPVDLTVVGYSILITCSGIGGVIGALLTIPIQWWLGKRWVIGLNILGNAVMFGVPALTTNAWLIGGAAVLGGITGPLWTIATASYIGRTVPTTLQGRVNAAYGFLGSGSLTIGAILAGLIAQFFGLQVVFALSACLTLGMLIPFFLVVKEQAMM